MPPRVLQTAGINDVWTYHELHLDSSARDGGSNESPFFALSRPLHDVVGLQLLHVDVALNFKLVDWYNNRVSIGINTNDYAGPNPTAQVVRLPPGTYTSLDDLAQAVAASFDPMLQRSFPGRYRMDVDGDENGNLVFRIVDRNSGVFCPPDPNGIYQFSIAVQGERPDLDQLPRSPMSPFSVAASLGFEEGRLYWHLPNTFTPPLAPRFRLPRALYLGASFADLISDQILFNGTSDNAPAALERLPITDWIDRRLVLDSPQSTMFFSIPLSTVQNLTLYLRFAESFWKSLPLDLNGTPWSLTLGVLTQKEQNEGPLVAF